MKVAFEDVKNPLLGLNCCYIKVVYGSDLRIGLGEKIFYNSPRLKGKFYGEWDISSRYCGWRIFKDDVVICGYNDEIEDCNKVLETTELGKLINIFQLGKGDLRIEFEKDIVVDFLCQSTDEPVLIILGDKDKVSYELTLYGWVRSRSDEPESKMTAIEKALSSHSEECQDRWSKLVKESSSEEKCSDCFYFRGIYGGFYFWDYGLCSNKESEYDGKLVGVKSGCDSFGKLSDLIE